MTAQCKKKLHKYIRDLEGIVNEDVRNLIHKKIDDTEDVGEVWSNFQNEVEKAEKEKLIKVL